MPHAILTLTLFAHANHPEQGYGRPNGPTRERFSQEFFGTMRAIDERCFDDSSKDIAEQQL